MIKKWAVPLGIGLAILVTAIQLIRIGNLQVEGVYGEAGVDAETAAKAAAEAAAKAVKAAPAPPRVADGDSFEWQDTEVRLYGIDAFELKQRCKTSGGYEYGCGYEARQALVKLLKDKELKCERKDVDAYGRMVAVCTADGVDVAKQLVKQGLALAYTRYSKDYVADERRARADKVGAWGGSFEAPWDWRSKHKRK